MVTYYMVNTGSCYEQSEWESYITYCDTETGVITQYEFDGPDCMNPYTEDNPEGLYYKQVGECE